MNEAQVAMVEHIISAETQQAALDELCDRLDQTKEKARAGNVDAVCEELGELFCATGGLLLAELLAEEK